MYAHKDDLAEYHRMMDRLWESLPGSPYDEWQFPVHMEHMAHQKGWPALDTMIQVRERATGKWVRIDARSYLSKYGRREEYA